MVSSWRGVGVHVAVLLLLVVGVPAARGMEVVEGGYEGLLVAISPDLAEDTTVIPAIKTAMKEMSRAVFFATGSRLFFRNVTILVPQSWPDVKVDYDATTQNYQDAIIRVEGQNPSYGAQPYTVQAGGCGEAGRYLHLTQEYLTSDKACAWGPKGKTLAREWAKVRWGVFDELGYLGDPIFPLFYWHDLAPSSSSSSSSSSSPPQYVFKPNYCANQPITGEFIDPASELPCESEDKNCRFVPQYLQNATASIMSQHFISNIEGFCDTGREDDLDHDPWAPNRHNLVCGGQSVWQVIKRHPDFGGEDKKEVKRMDPSFLVVRATEAKYVLLFEVSPSMNKSGDVAKARDAARRWILNDLREGSRVAIIIFGLISWTVTGLTKVTDGASRRALVDSLTKLNLINGATCYTCALRSAIVEAKGHNNTAFLLFTDGDPNVYTPSLPGTVQEELAYLGIRVVAMVFSNKSHDLMESLAQETGGRVYYNRSEDAPQRLFQDALSAQPRIPLHLDRIWIHETEFSGKARLYNSTFVVDSRLNRKLKFRLSTNASREVSAVPYLVNPSKTRVETKKSEFNVNLWTAEVDEPQVGLWWWEVGLRGRKDVWVSVDISATPNTELPPIHVQAWLNTSSDSIDAQSSRVSVHARVLQGTAPVLKAQVRLVVTLVATNASYSLTLQDSGSGCDAMAGDGLYSRFLTNLTTTGRHVLKVKVWGDDKTTYHLDDSFLLSADLRSPVAKASCYSDISAEDPPTYCCGSVVPSSPKYLKATGNFTRLLPLGTINVTAVPKKRGEDDLGPLRVVDLRVKAISKVTLHLEWTAAGDDLDQGAAYTYELHLATRLDSLGCSPQGHPSLVWPDPNRYSSPPRPKFGEPVSVSANLTEAMVVNTLYYVTMCAVDNVGNTSPLSNICRIMVKVTIVRPLQLNLSVMKYVMVGVIVAAVLSCIFGG